MKTSHNDFCPWETYIYANNSGEAQKPRIAIAQSHIAGDTNPDVDSDNQIPLAYAPGGHNFMHAQMQTYVWHQEAKRSTSEEVAHHQVLFAISAGFAATSAQKF